MPTGAARTSTSGHTSPTRSETSGSMFDQRQPPKLPLGLPPDVRKHAKDLFSHNVHLWDDAQLNPVLRLARIRAEIDKLTIEIDREGYMIEGRNAPIINPMIAARSGAMKDALSLERQLGITFVARSGNVKKAELEKPAQPKVSQGRQARVLKLA